MVAKTLWVAVFVSGLNQTAVIASGLGERRATGHPPLRVCLGRSKEDLA